LGTAGFEPVDFAIGPDDTELDAKWLAGLYGVRDGIGEVMAVVGKDKLEREGFAVQVREGAAEDFRRALVPKGFHGL
jgi:hypothetical protein